VSKIHSHLTYSLHITLQPLRNMQASLNGILLLRTLYNSYAFIFHLSNGQLVYPCNSYLTRLPEHDMKVKPFLTHIQLLTLTLGYVDFR
jgi:hypothetical protein